MLDYLARTITHNGRDLEGAVNRLLAHSKLNATAVTLEMAEREVRDLVRPQEPKRIKIEDIQRAVARQYNVSRSDLLSSRRTANVVRPRQVAMYLAKTLTCGRCRKSDAGSVAVTTPRCCMPCARSRPSWPRTPPCRKRSSC